MNIGKIAAILKSAFGFVSADCDAVTGGIEISGVARAKVRQNWLQHQLPTTFRSATPPCSMT